MLSRFTTLLAAACIGSFAVSAQSALVVDYDVDTNGTGSLAAPTVFPNLDLDGDTLNDDSRVLRAFTDVGGTPWSTGAGYVGPTLFGGAIGESFNKPNRNFGDYGLLNIRYQANATNESGRVHMALIFEASQTGLTFDTGGSGTSSMTVSGNGGAGVNMTRFENLGDVRWLVRNGTSFYVSNTQVANTTNGRVLDATELASETWALYDPNDGFAFNLNLNFNTPTSALTDMNAFGLIVYKTALDQTRSWISFAEFKVDAVPVPEPASLALLGIGGMLMVGRKRR